MPGTATGQGHTRRGERWLGLCRALVFLLIVTHVILMASERHTAVMGPQMGAAPAMGTIARLLPGVAAHAGDEAGQPTVPHHAVLGDCPAQQTVPPLFLLLLLLMALLRRLLPIFAQGAHLRLAWPCPHFLPPPLDPARRRALLQVFLN